MYYLQAKRVKIIQSANMVTSTESLVLEIYPYAAKQVKYNATQTEDKAKGISS